jgi:hypothetical protein
MSAAALNNPLRRPLETASDDETEDEDKQNSAKAESKDAEIAADELLVKKKARYARPFTEDILTLPDGLQRIYEEFPLTCKFRGRGSEAKDIKKLMSTYREWAFQLYPGLAFPDIVSRCEALGGKAKTRTTLEHLREQERDRYIVSAFCVIYFLVLLVCNFYSRFTPTHQNEVLGLPTTFSSETPDVSPNKSVRSTDMKNGALDSSFESRHWSEDEEEELVVVDAEQEAMWLQLEALSAAAAAAGGGAASGAAAAGGAANSAGTATTTSDVVASSATAPTTATERLRRSKVITDDDEEEEMGFDDEDEAAGDKDKSMDEQQADVSEEGAEKEEEEKEKGGLGGGVPAATEAATEAAEAQAEGEAEAEAASSSSRAQSVATLDGDAGGSGQHQHHLAVLEETLTSPEAL